jgi:hypothetical protein
MMTKRKKMKRKIVIWLRIQKYDCRRASMPNPWGWENIGCIVPFNDWEIEKLDREAKAINNAIRRLKKLYNEKM